MKPYLSSFRVFCVFCVFRGSAIELTTEYTELTEENRKIKNDKKQNHRLRKAYLNHVPESGYAVS